jgi:hypothetical protein
MRPYRDTDKVTEEQAKALLYAWWTHQFRDVSNGDVGIDSYIVHWLYKAKGLCSIRTISDTEVWRLAHWGDSTPTFKALWSHLATAPWYDHVGFCYITIVKEFMNAKTTRKEVTEAARRSSKRASNRQRPSRG